MEVSSAASAIIFACRAVIAPTARASAVSGNHSRRPASLTSRFALPWDSRNRSRTATAASASPRRAAMALTVSERNAATADSTRPTRPSRSSRRSAPNEPNPSRRTSNTTDNQPAGSAPAPDAFTPPHPHTDTAEPAGALSLLAMRVGSVTGHSPRVFGRTRVDSRRRAGRGRPTPLRSRSVTGTPTLPTPYDTHNTCSLTIRNRFSMPQNSSPAPPLAPTPTTTRSRLRYMNCRQQCRV